jgi:hypothetical protein
MHPKNNISIQIHFVMVEIISTVLMSRDSG